MNSSKTILIILAVIILGAVVWTGVSQPKAQEEEVIAEGSATTEEARESSNNDRMMAGEDKGIMMDIDHDSTNDEKMMPEEDGSTKSSSGTYEEYSDENLAEAKKGKTLLFFHATWCPTCRAADKNISENQKDIPEGLTILKANYDKDTALRKKYGVTTQHTFVQIDANGELVNKFSGQRNLDQIVSKLK